MFEDWEHFLRKIPLKMLLKGSISFSNRKFKYVIKANTCESASKRRPSVSAVSVFTRDILQDGLEDIPIYHIYDLQPQFELQLTYSKAISSVLM